MKMRCCMFVAYLLSFAIASDALAQSLMFQSGAIKPASEAPVTALAPAPANQGPGPVFAAGRAGGAYEIVAKKVVKFFAANQSGLDLQVRSYGGSQANLDELTTDSSPVVMAAVQLNDLLSKQSQIGQDELTKKAMRIGPIGKECAFMLALKGGAVSDLDDLANKRGTLYVVGKGANSIWRILARIYSDDLSKVTVVTEQPGAAGKALETADAVSLVLDSGKMPRAMLIVQLNNFPLSPDARQMIDQLENDHLALVPLDWRKFDDEIPGLGQPFTTEKGLLLKKGAFSRDVATNTVCTDSLVVYNPGKVVANKALSDAMSTLKANPAVVKFEPAGK